MTRNRARTSLICASLALVTSACARDPAQEQLKARFDAARQKCAVTVAETPDVKRCMRAQGWAYRLPWQ